MTGTRRRGRELALQALYQLDVTGGDVQTGAGDLWRHFGEDEQPAHIEESRAFAAELVEGVVAMRPRLDELITASAAHWRLDRLSQIDRNILRLGAYEIVGRIDVPASVAIDEAIEIAKRFGSEDSPTFVNGVLDHIATVAGAKEGRREL
jgi:N utilization substance protein B